MKKALVIALLALSMIPVGFNITANPGSNYEPIIEGCITQVWPVEGYNFVMACIPGGNQSCQVEWCSGLGLIR